MLHFWGVEIVNTHKFIISSIFQLEFPYSYLRQAEKELKERKRLAKA
jgi:hypothetical protein